MYLSRVVRPLVRTNHLKAGSLGFYRTSTTSAQIDNGTQLKPFNEIPGPTGLHRIPYFGTALLFKPFSKHGIGEVNEVLNDLRDKYGDIFKIRFGKDDIVFVNNPDLAKTVFLAPYEKHERLALDITAVYAERTGSPKSITLLNGQEWAERRKPTQEKMLRPAIVATYVPLIEQVTNDFVQKLRKKEKIDDLLEELANYATESVGMLCFNKRLGSLDDGASNPTAVCIKQLFEIAHESLFMPFKTFKHFRTKLYRRWEAVNHKFAGIVNKEITSQREFLAKMEKEGKLEEYLEKEPNFMYSLLSDTRMDDSAVNTVIMDLFGAGIDTTSNTLVFLLSELALNKDKQTKLYEEIDTIVGNSPNLTKEHLGRMSYLKACLKESHRKLYPVSSGVIRFIESDLAVGGYSIPKGEQIIINNRSMVTDERFFPKPKEFIPERWLRETTGEMDAKQYPFASKPFGFGARSCLGQRFAETEVFIAVTKIIQNFEITMPSGVTEVKSTLKLFTTPAEKVGVILKERQKG